MAGCGQGFLEIMAGWQSLLQLCCSCQAPQLQQRGAHTSVDLRRMPIRFMPGPYWQLPGQPPLLTGGSTGLMLQRSSRAAVRPSSRWFTAVRDELQKNMCLLASASRRRLRGRATAAHAEAGQRQAAAYWPAPADVPVGCVGLAAGARGPGPGAESGVRPHPHIDVGEQQGTRQRPAGRGCLRGVREGEGCPVLSLSDLALLETFPAHAPNHPPAYTTAPLTKRVKPPHLCSSRLPSFITPFVNTLNMPLDPAPTLWVRWAWMLNPSSSTSCD